MENPHCDAQVVYVIPEVTQPEEKDPLKDENLTLEKITKLINKQNEELKLNFKKFCEAPPESEEKTQMQLKLNQSK